MLFKIKDGVSINEGFFDVGANDGSTFLALASNDKDFLVYAFEPTPEMCDAIKSKTSDLSNYLLIVT